MICYVLVELNRLEVDKPYSYKVDFTVHKNIRIGSRVLVPFGNRNVEGFVLDLKDGDETNLKSIVTVYPDGLNSEQISLLFYLRKKNVSSLIECVNTIIPPAFRASVKNKEKSKKQRYIRLIDLNYNNDKVKSLLDRLKQENISLTQAIELSSTYTLNKLVEMNVIEKYDQEVYREVLSDIESKKLYEVVNEEQKVVVNNIVNSTSLYHLIYGRTGSGKTVCYLELINKTLNDNKQVLILVPEISLTPQYIAILKHHINEDFAVFHSKLSSNVRNDQYKKIVDGKVNIAIGTRSSVFLPFNNLGLIIMDEEHDNSYIQEGSVSYNTKEIASFRAKHYNAKFVMGSASPDVVTYYKALNGYIKLHKLENKYGSALVSTKVINMKSNFDYILSSELISRIKDVIENKKQFILLLNKRGYVNYLVCENCGKTLNCPHCSVALKLHKGGVFKCHYCDFNRSDVRCECGSEKYIENGYGIQKVEELLHDNIEVKIERVDLDTVSKLSFLENVFSNFNDQKYDGLIGTQILSKGLDFKNIALVAIIDADYALSLSNYRSSENTFQYIIQSLGRSGRSDVDALNIVQCYNSDHYAVQCALNQDYESFYNEEIKYRENVNYPPFSQVIKVFMSSTNLNLLYNTINNVYSKLKSTQNDVAKPSFSNIEKINSTYRMQIIIKVKKNAQFFDIIDIVRAYNLEKFVNMYVCLNPTDF